MALAVSSATLAGKAARTRGRQRQLLFLSHLHRGGGISHPHHSVLAHLGLVKLLKVAGHHLRRGSVIASPRHDGSLSARHPG